MKRVMTAIVLSVLGMASSAQTIPFLTNSFTKAEKPMASDDLMKQILSMRGKVVLVKFDSVLNVSQMTENVYRTQMYNGSTRGPCCIYDPEGFKFMNKIPTASGDPNQKEYKVYVYVPTEQEEKDIDVLMGSIYDKTKARTGHRYKVDVVILGSKTKTEPMNKASYFW